MFISSEVGSVSQKYIFGKCADESINISLSHPEYEVLGTRLKSIIAPHQNVFALTWELFDGLDTQFTNINAFLVLEELAILINSGKLPESDKEMLMKIYSSLKTEVYSVGVANLHVM